MVIKLFTCDDKPALKCGFEKSLVVLSLASFIVLLVLLIRGVRLDRNIRRSKYRSVVFALCILQSILVFVHYAFARGGFKSGLAIVEEKVRAFSYLVSSLFIICLDGFCLLLARSGHGAR